MDQNTYKILRAFCVQDIGGYIPKLAEIENNPSLAKKFGAKNLTLSEVALALDNAVAHDLLGLSGDSIGVHQSDLTPRELAAAKLLKACSGARLIAINHEKFGTDERTEEQAQKATGAVRQAAKAFSLFLLKKDASALLSFLPKATSRADAPKKTKKSADKPPKLSGRKSLQESMGALPFALKRNPDDVAKAIVDAGNSLYLRIGKVPSAQEVINEMIADPAVYALEYNEQSKKFEYITATGESRTSLDRVKFRYNNYLQKDFKR